MTPPAVRHLRMVPAAATKSEEKAFASGFALALANMLKVSQAAARVAIGDSGLTLDELEANCPAGDFTFIRACFH